MNFLQVLTDLLEHPEKIDRIISIIEKIINLVERLAPLFENHPKLTGAILDRLISKSGGTQ